MKKTILYISTNNGSDTRINKELKSLSKEFNIVFLGVGKYNSQNFAKEYCTKFILIQGKRNRPLTIIKHIAIFLKIILSKKINSIHVINEQLMVFFYPFLFFKHTVLDIFDSIFLKMKKPKNQYALLKRIVYAPINKILVTDENRKKLMPNFAEKKISILENYPYKYINKTKKNQKKDTITIFYFGTLNTERGTSFLNDLLNYSDKIKLIMAGWINDEATKKLISHKNVLFKGVLTQQEASKISATETDYIMCCYEPNNHNNINASPNKIFDAIQTKTPVIINSEVKIATFVKVNNIGYILDSYYNYNVEKVYNELRSKKDTYSFSDKDSIKYSWENIEHKLLKAHKTKSL